MVMAQVQVLLSEKRTALSMFRTGVVIMVFAISMLSAVLILEDGYGLEDYGLMILASVLLIYSLSIMIRAQSRVQQIDQRVKVVIGLLPPLKNTIGDLLED